MWIYHYSGVVIYNGVKFGYVDGLAELKEKIIKKELYNELKSEILKQFFIDGNIIENKDKYTLILITISLLNYRSE